MLIYKTRMAGPYHIENGLPCQDSLAIDQNNSRFTIAAVADGLGSELHSDIGSSVAAKTAVEYCSKSITADMTFSEIKKVMNNAFVYAYKAVLTRASADGNDSGEYDTTLCLAVYDGERLYWAQSGDSGMVALLEDGSYYRVTTQQRDAEGYVFPLCFGPAKWEFGAVDAPVCAVMLMTDGVFEQVCPKLMRRSEIDVNVPLAQRFLDKFDRSDDDAPELEEAAYQYLKNYPQDLLDDDKTVVVLINTKRKPARREDAYYAIPDWEGLMDEVEKKLAAASEEDAEEAKPEEPEPCPAESEDKEEGEAAPKAEPEAEGPKDGESKPAPEATAAAPAEERKRKRKSKRKSKDNAAPSGPEGPPADGKKESAAPRDVSTVGLDALTVICLLLFGLLAWFAKGEVEKCVPLSVLGVAVVCFLANASVLLPSSSILIVVEASLILPPLLVAVCGALGAALGEMTGFFVGKYGRGVIPERLMKRIGIGMKGNQYAMVLLFSALPLPVFDVVGMLSGAARMNAVKFYGTCFAGKLVKMLSYVWLAHTLIPMLG